MKDTEEVDVENITVLLEHMKSKEFHVKWRVLSEFGPEWMGSRRDICFMLGGVPLGESRFHDELKKSLIKLVNIPERSSDHVIDGEGDVARVGDVLIVSYEWSAAIPYWHPSDGGQGRGVLWSIR